MPTLACGVIRRSSPPSTSAALRASGRPATLKLVPRLWNASAAVGVTSPKAYCQATEARGVSCMPLVKAMLVAMRAPSEE
ncbi:hypothetical protein ACVWY2_009662 [Bradyrhizobium sp. JR6.1]